MGAYGFFGPLLSIVVDQEGKPEKHVGKSGKIMKKEGKKREKRKDNWGKNRTNKGT